MLIFFVSQVQFVEPREVHEIHQSRHDRIRDEDICLVVDETAVPVGVLEDEGVDEEGDHCRVQELRETRQGTDIGVESRLGGESLIAE